MLTPVLEENWQVLAVVFPPFAQRLENSESSGLLARLHLTRCFPQFASTTATDYLNRRTGEADWGCGRPIYPLPPLIPDDP